ncbi:Ig-like domain-containing protein [Salmonella enterica]
MRELNQFRTFARGFNNLKAGDEIDVPLFPLAEDTKQSSSDSKAPADDKQNLQTMAGIASRSGAFLANSPDSDSLMSMASGYASAKANKEINDWLNLRGKARVQLDLNKKEGAKNTQFDLLVPIVEDKKNLFFTQQSVHRSDERTQANLGLGYRAFGQYGMWGVNAFIDHDLSRGHTRAGMGVEYWRDYMKLSANGYRGLSGWKHSRDLEDYQERPANGWDLRAQAWLPALPQLGGKLVYEQYYGNEVALFDQDKRQRNPHAVTLGIDYTPFPLLTLNAEHSQGQSGNNDSRIGLQINYQLGVPWHKQLDPSAVGQMRTLAGSRYDFVDRNNNIVLEYRKEEVIHLHTADLITGNAREEKSLAVSVDSKYGVEKIDWSAAELNAAGGKIVRKGTTAYNVVLPDYRANGENSYTISAVAIDKKGNTSAPAQTQVTVKQAAISTLKSSFTPRKSELKADGKTQLKLVLKLNDNQGNPVDVPVSEIQLQESSKLRTKKSSQLGSLQREAAGEYIAILTVGTLPESLLITPLVRGVKLAPADVTVSVDSATAQIAEGHLVVVKNNAIANGKATNSVKATVTDAGGNLLHGQTVNFSAGNGAKITSSGKTGSDGTVEVTLTSLQAGASKVTATINGSSRSQSVNFVADNATAEIVAGSLVVVKNNAKADGKATNSVKATVKDAQGNTVANQNVAFTASNSASIAASGTTNAQGEVTMTLTSTKAGQSSVTASVNGSSQSQTVTFVANDGTAQIASGNLVVVKNNAIADGKETNSVKATVTDANGNLLSGQSVTFKADNGADITGSGTTDAKGEVLVTLTSTHAGKSKVTASINGSTQNQTVTFIADNNTAQIENGNLVVVKDKAKANGTDANSVKATVTDANGNVLSGQTVNFTADNGALITANGITDAKGEVVVVVTSTRAGESQVTASIKSSKQSKAVTFIADSATAQIAALVVEKDNAKANGTDANSVKATVTDANGNILSGQKVSFSADNGATIAASGTTDAKGEITQTLTSTKAGQSTVTASVNGSSEKQTMNFVADNSTAQIGTLIVTSDNAAANGSDTNSVKATVTDANGNTLANQNVSFNADNGATIVASGTTDAKGEVTVTLKSITAGESTVTASVNGSSKTAKVTFVADTSTVKIASLIVLKDNAKANGKESNSVKATVTDANGNIVTGQSVSFTADNGAAIAASATTDAKGEAAVTLTSTKAGQSSVTASVNSSRQSQTLTFVADTATAQVATLVVVKDNAKADGIDTNSVKATVTDANGNIVSGQSVSFAADNGATIAASGTTDAKGEVSMTLTSIKAGQSSVTASTNGSNQRQALTFVADTSTAQIATLVVVKDNAKANGTDTNSVKATVTDANGNIVAGRTVSFTADNGATIATSGTTDAKGEVTITLISTRAGQSNVTASINGSNQSQAVNFVADNSTAQVATLVVVKDNATANGTDTNSVKATVTDASGNILAAQVVSFTADNGASITANGTTDAKGEVTMTLTSTKAGQSKVTASVNGSSQNQMLTFVADAATAEITSLVVVKDDAKADGSDTDSVKATVSDANGNLLSGQSVSFTADNGATIAASGTTDAQGEVTMTLTSSKAVQSKVTASVNGSSQSQTVSFVADSTSAQVTSLVVVKDQAIANGTDTNSVKATVKDANGNLLAGQSVSFKADNGSTIAADGTTDAKGEVTMTLTSTKAGQSNVTASVNGSSQSQLINFVADNTTAQIASGSLVVVQNNAQADGSQTNSVKATVTDANGNLLSGQTVAFTADNGATIAASGTTDAQGEVSMTLTSNTVGQSAVTASINGSSQSVKVTFASLIVVTLTVEQNDIVADGVTTGSIKATVTELGKLMAGKKVTFSPNKSQVYITPENSGVTDANGEVSATISAVTGGVVGVTATVDGNTATVNVNFKGITLSANTYKNSYSFAKDFPEYGFENASFAMEITDSNLSDYDVSISAGSNKSPSWITVDDAGIVTFLAKPPSSETEVTISAKRKGTTGKLLSYHFMLTGWWFVSPPSQVVTGWTAQSAYCTTNGGRIPDHTEASKGENIRAVGSLFSEWGNISAYGFGTRPAYVAGPRFQAPQPFTYMTAYYWNVADGYVGVEEVVQEDQLENTGVASMCIIDL